MLAPHRSYYNCFKDLFERKELVGLAHITGGGIKENLNRILPEGLSAKIDLAKIKILPIFNVLKKYGDLEDDDVLRTFNVGVGITAVVRESFVREAISHLEKHDVDAYEIGIVAKGDKNVDFEGQLRWS